MKKKTITLISIAIIIALFTTACNKKTEGDGDMQASIINETSETQNVKEDITQVPTEYETEVPKLSETCNIVLASGYSGDDYYELVANETETHLGTEVEVGVIKNNTWSVNLTSNLPFIKKDKSLSNNKTIYDSIDYFHYVGNGCFFYPGVILNGKTGEYAKGKFMVLCQGKLDYTKGEYFVSEEGKYLYLKNGYQKKGNDKNYYILDTNDMSSTKVNFTYQIGYFAFPFSNGIFAHIKKGNSNKVGGFYNTDGEMIFDLSDYNTNQMLYSVDGTGGKDSIKQALVFKNGECSFRVKNKQKSEFYITINTNGEVIREEKIS